jgi:hypothetical protein
MDTSTPVNIAASTHWLDLAASDTAIVVAVLFGLLLLALLALGLRRRGITRRAGTFECCLRAPGRRRFTLAIARYSGDQLECFRWLSLHYRPRSVLDRSELTVTGKRAATAGEATLLGVADVVVLEFRTDAGQGALALGERALTGVRAWIESAPPRPFVP